MVLLCKGVEREIGYLLHMGECAGPIHGHGFYLALLNQWLTEGKMGRHGWGVRKREADQPSILLCLLGGVESRTSTPFSIHLTTLPSKDLCEKCGPCALRTRSIRRSWPCKVRWTHTTPQSTIATSAMMTAVQWNRIARRLPMTTGASTVANSATLTMPLLPSWLLLSLGARKWQRMPNAEVSHPRRKGRPLRLPAPTDMARTWHTPSLPWPLPKALTSSWLSLWTPIDSTRQWMVLLCH